MKPFNLEKALNGDTVCVCSGEIVYDLRISDKVTDAFVLTGVLYGMYQTFTSEGKFQDRGFCTPSYDLFMASVKKEGWVNIVINEAKKTIVCNEIFLTKEMAINRSPFGLKLIDTIKISWEE